jgi:magnesium transporter
MSAKLSIFTYTGEHMDYAQCRHIDEVLARVNPDRVNWITLSGITLPEDHDAVKTLLDYFQLPPHLFRRIFNREQQQFEGEYDDCLYLEHSVLLYNPANGAYTIAEGCLILSTNVLILLEKLPTGLFEATRARIVAKRTRAHRYGADYLLYLLLRTIVTNYQHIMKELVKKFEVLEDTVIGHPGRDFVYDQILELREEVKPIYEHLITLDDFVDALKEQDSRFITPKTRKFFIKTLHRKTLDLFVDYQYLRTWITELVEIHRANVNENTNRVMKTLTIFSAIFLPLTFIAGVYGMNFEYMPELGWKWGYPAVLILMVGLSVGAILYMRQKKWL